MRRLLLPLYVVLAGSIFVGCPSATYLGYDIPDKTQPELVVESSVKGLSHVQHLCIVTAATRDYIAESQAFMDPNAAEPQVVRTFLRKWRKNPQDKPWLQDIAPGALRFYFIYNGGHDFFRGERPTVEVPPQWDPIALQRDEATRPPRDPKPQPSPSPRPSPSPTDDGGDTVVEHVLDTRPKTFSQNPNNPTPIKFRQGLADFECSVSRNSGPQYARLDGAGNRIRVKIEVTSHQSTGSATWWSLEVVDKNGESLADQQQELGFIDPGASATQEVEWQLTGNARLLKINSGSEAGDTLKVSIAKADR